MITAAAIQSDIRQAITVLRMQDCQEDARLLFRDLCRAGEDVRELLMVRDDAERLLEESLLD